MGHGTAAGDGELREAFPLAAAGLPPSAAAVLDSQGIPADSGVRERISRLVDRARELYADLADPRGLWAEIGRSEFAVLYRGEGLNEQSTPLEQIYPRADRLALFAATMGESLSSKISELFSQNDPALAFMLDAIASERAEWAAELAARCYLEHLVKVGSALSPTAILAYSPGYCGWHITGQRKLFEYLRPEAIGITLNDSCLMQPLKSVSGVLVAGSSGIHQFEDSFDFCDECSTHGCRERIAALKGES
jgi:hypothetical protein